MPVAAVRVAASAPARAMTRGSPNLRAGVLRPSASVDGCAIRSKAGLARTVPWPARSASSMRRLMARALSCSSARLGGRALQRSRHLAHDHRHHHHQGPADTPAAGPYRTPHRPRQRRLHRHFQRRATAAQGPGFVSCRRWPAAYQGSVDEPWPAAGACSSLSPGWWPRDHRGRCLAVDQSALSQPQGRSVLRGVAAGAAAAAWRRLVTPSLRMMFDTCTLAVFSLI
jgi:hypothetical protein